MDEKIKEAFGQVWPVHVGSLMRFLIGCRKSFGGDLDLFLILTIIGERTYSHRHASRGVNFQAFQTGSATDTLRLDINIRSLAEFSGIPRETVRRKTDILIERGWVTRTQEGFLVATRKAREDLEPLTAVSMQYISEMMNLLREFS